MHALYSLAAALLCTGIGIAHADDAHSAAQTQWFTPPASQRGATIDVSSGDDATETVTIIARRASRTWRSKLADERLNDPLASDAARPRESFADQKSYCNASLRTVGGQPASAADMVSGSGAGGC